MKHDLTLEMDSHLPLRDVVYKTLRNAILRGELKPGDRLMEMHLANKLGVSRTPIREAIHLLEEEGLAITIPRKGAQVAKMTKKDLEDVLEIRDALDMLAAKRACQKMTKEDFSQMDEVMEEFKAAIRMQNISQIVQADEKFHDIIYRAAGNKRLESMVSHLREQMHRYRYEYIKDTKTFEPLLSEHTMILESLRGADEDKVIEYMHLHLMNQILAMKTVIDRQDKNE